MIEKIKRITCIDRHDPADRPGKQVFDAYATGHIPLEEAKAEDQEQLEFDFLDSLRARGYEPCPGNDVRKSQTPYKERNWMLYLLSIPCVRTNTQAMAAA